MPKKKLAIHPLQLLDINLDEVKAKVLREFEDNGQPQLVVDVSVESEVISELVARTFFTIKIGFDSEPFFEIEARFKGIMKSFEPCSQEDLKEFAENQSVPPIWPFAREYIASLTQRMGFPSVMLPTINVFNTINANQKQDQDQIPEVNMNN